MCTHKPFQGVWFSVAGGIIVAPVERGVGNEEEGPRSFSFLPKQQT